MKRTRQHQSLLLAAMAAVWASGCTEFASSFSIQPKRKSGVCCCRLRPHPSATTTLYINNNNNNNNNNKLDWNPDSFSKIAQSASYSDDWLLNFHNRDQSQKQLVTNSLAAWNEFVRDEQSSTILEWQDSFQRNELADFTPPMSNGLNCLMVGDDFDVCEDADGNRRVRLPWEDTPEARVTSLRVLEESLLLEDEEEEEEPITGVAAVSKEAVRISTAERNGKETIDVDALVNNELSSETATTFAAGSHGGNVRTELVSWDGEDDSASSEKTKKNTNAMRTTDPHRLVAAYDCIVDKGLLDRILALLPDSHDTVRELLEEAAVALRDLGIYVLVTKEALTDEARVLLDEHGRTAGLEWQFELDGISSPDTHTFVSVARRFNTGELPRVGKLSRYQPPPV